MHILPFSFVAPCLPLPPPPQGLGFSKCPGLGGTSPVSQPFGSLPNSNSIARFKSNKKRKKSDADAFPRVKPEVMPPKPQFTYAQLCYRAIKALGGRASLQDICQWIQDSYEWYKYSDKDWEVRTCLLIPVVRSADRGAELRTTQPIIQSIFQESRAWPGRERQGSSVVCRPGV